MTAPAGTKTSGARKKNPSERGQAPERSPARAAPREQRARQARQPPDRRQSSDRRQSQRQSKAEARAKAQVRPQQSRSSKAKSSRAKQLQTKVVFSRAPFVVAVMSVLVAGIVGTLWLSISAVSNSYELQKAQTRVNALSERKETLVAEVSRMSSIPAVQQRARELGLVPGPDPAHLRVHPDGSVTVVGEPVAAKAPDPAPPPPEQVDSQQSSQQGSPTPEARRP